MNFNFSTKPFTKTSDEIIFSPTRFFLWGGLFFIIFGMAYLGVIYHLGLLQDVLANPTDTFAMIIIFFVTLFIVGGLYLVYYGSRRVVIDKQRKTLSITTLFGSQYIANLEDVARIVQEEELGLSARFSCYLKADPYKNGIRLCNISLLLEIKWKTKMFELIQEIENLKDNSPIVEEVLRSSNLSDLTQFRPTKIAGVYSYRYIDNQSFPYILLMTVAVLGLVLVKGWTVAVLLFLLPPYLLFFRLSEVIIDCNNHSVLQIEWWGLRKKLFFYKDGDRFKFVDKRIIIHLYRRTQRVELVYGSERHDILRLLIGRKFPDVIKDIRILLTTD